MSKWLLAVLMVIVPAIGWAEDERIIFKTRPRPEEVITISSKDERFLQITMKETADDKLEWSTQLDQIKEIIINKKLREVVRFKYVDGEVEDDYR